MGNTTSTSHHGPSPCLHPIPCRRCVRNDVLRELTGLPRSEVPTHKPPPCPFCAEERMVREEARRERREEREWLENWEEAMRKGGGGRGGGGGDGGK